MTVLQKKPTGIHGLDDVLDGGLPGGRPTLIYGGPGSGKTFMAIEFLTKGALEHDEPGVFMSFEESPTDITCNFQGAGMRLTELIENGKLYLTQAHDPAGRTLMAGDFSLDALIIRLSSLIQKVDAKRLVLDNLGSIFHLLGDSPNLREELVILFEWIKKKGITTIITAEKDRYSDRSLYGFEEHLCDCAIFLDNRIDKQVAKRRLRVIKFRGSSHILDEVPFTLNKWGISVIPLTSAKLTHEVSKEIIPTGIDSLDQLFETGGYYKGSSILITGKSGSGKSAVAAAFTNSVCQSGQTCIYFSFEESPGQILRNMASLGIDLKPYIDAKLLTIVSARPTVYGLEEHIVNIHNRLKELKPHHVVLDPISNFQSMGNLNESNAMLTRIIDEIKKQDITSLMTALIEGSGRTDETTIGISSIMDTWIELEQNSAANQLARSLHIIKSRGMKHSQIRHPFHMAHDGLRVSTELA